MTPIASPEPVPGASIPLVNACRKSRFITASNSLAGMGDGVGSNANAGSVVGFACAANASGHTGYTKPITLTFNDPPEIQVSGNGTVITAGDATPSATDHTDFGSVVAGTAPCAPFPALSVHPPLTDVLPVFGPP